MLKRKLALTLVVLGILLAISAGALNASAGRASITDDEDRRMAETALTALNEADYERFVENFGEKLKLFHVKHP